jgi:predicted RecA/RadA family phage recombinase
LRRRARLPDLSGESNVKNYIGPRSPITITAPSALTGGTPIIVGTLLCIPAKTEASGDQAAVHIDGCWEIAKATGEAWTLFAKVYWDDTAKKMTTTATSNTLRGVAAKAAASGDTTGWVLLSGDSV